jgi:hypothetical protein
VAQKFRNAIQRNYLARDFDGFRAQLIEYARIFFPDKIQDFSEASLGGLLVDLAAFVGDTMSFYMDHQFNELDYTRATELINIENHLRNAGVKVRGKSPASTNVNFTITVDGTTQSTGLVVPDTTQLPKVLIGTEFTGGGTTFVTLEDVDFAKTDFIGQLLGTVEVATVNADGSPATFNITRQIPVAAGSLITENVSISNTFIPFRTVALANADVSSIIGVFDSDGNDYYEVDDLSQDNVFKAVSTDRPLDGSFASSNLEIIAAPYRFTTTTSLTTRLTTLRFGSGDGKAVQDDVLSDPADLALPLVGTTTFKKFSIDPKNLLESNSLGVSPRGTTLTITYLSGGGLNTNVAANTITNVSSLQTIFPSSATAAAVTRIRANATVTNPNPATGGDDALTVEELRAKIPSAVNSQNRIVTREDLLARVYTLPAQFGRVFRAGVSPSGDNNLSSDLYIICKDSAGKLAPASDTLKLNLRSYLNEFRLVSESIEIKDAKVINFGVEFTIRVRPNANKIVTVTNVINNLKVLLRTQNFQVGEPIIESDIIFSILNTPGVQALPTLKFRNFFGTVNDVSYSGEVFDLNANLLNGVIVPPRNSIFEVKFPNTDIIGSVL